MDEALKKFLESVDKSKFNLSPFVKRVEKPWGYELIFTPEDLPYTGKLMHIKAGKRQSLQIHDQKKETFFLAVGKGGALLENDKSEMERVEFEGGKGYNVKVGQRHRIFGITDCDVIEFSTPETGITYRLEDDYARGDETEELRKDPNRGWNK